MKVRESGAGAGHIGRDQTVTGRDGNKRTCDELLILGRDQAVTGRDHLGPWICSSSHLKKPADMSGVKEETQAAFAALTADPYQIGVVHVQTGLAAAMPGMVGVCEIGV